MGIFTLLTNLSSSMHGPTNQITEPICTYKGSNDAVWPYPEAAFWGLIDEKFQQNYIFPKIFNRRLTWESEKSKK